MRQCQTADAVKSLIEEPGWHLSSRVSWLGDTEARLLLEFPLYSYLVLGVFEIMHQLDASGKIVSILLWAASFRCLQLIWRRALDEEQTFWANALFVFSPLSIFFGQAFMPEMLIQLCAFGFLAALLAYRESHRPAHLLLCGLVGLLGMLVKTPAFSHYYLVAGLVLFEKESWRALTRLSYWTLLLISGACVKGWALLVDKVNQTGFPEWTASATLPSLIGSLHDRFTFHPYLKYAAYIGVFAVTPAGLVCGLAGLVAAAREAAKYRLLLYWCVSLAFFYACWGPRTAGEHSYYNLPALAPFCALFGVGIAAFREWLACRVSPQSARRLAATAAVVLVVPFAAIGSLYLFRQDRTTYEAALWARDNTSPGDLVLFKSNHRADVIDYAHITPFSYYAQRKAWVYTRLMGVERRARALSTSTWAVVTTHEAPDYVDKWRRLLRGGEAPFEPQDITWLETEGGFTRFAEVDQFTVYRKTRVPER